VRLPAPGLGALAACLAALLPASALAGGGYDYNHGHVRWNTLETPHFFFHWPESTRPPDHERYFTTEFTAAQLARIAEESYPGITEQFDYDLEEKTHVVIYDQDLGWEGNGFAIAEYDWTGFAANWGPTFRERGRMEFLSDVFVHEFAHIVSLKAYLPWSENSSGFEAGGLIDDEEWLRRWGLDLEPGVNVDIGVNLLGTAHTPFWWAEGGAEYWSHQAGYNFWGTSRDAFLRMTVHEGRVLSEAEWTTRVDKVGHEGERGYNHGYAFALWLRKRCGNEAMTEMARTSGKRWHWSWDRVVEKTTGVPMEDLYGEWRRHVDTYYGAQIAAVQERGIVAGRELSLTEPPWEKPDEDWEALSKKDRDEAMDGSTPYVELPVYAPDGKHIAWFEHGLNVMAIRPEEWGAVSGTYVDEEDTKALTAWGKRITTEDFLHYHRVDFSPDGTRLVATGPEDLPARFLRDSGLSFNADGYDWSQLVVGTIRDDGNRLRVDWEHVPNTLKATESAWHPDGVTLAFARYGDGTHEVWTIGVDGTGARQLTDFGDGTQVQALDWSPDGKQLLVTLYRNYQQDLWLLEVETKAWTRLTDSRADESDPSFGPEGKVWFTSDRGGIFNIYSLDLETREVRQHSNVIGGAYGAWVAPDGDVFYTAITGHGFRVTVLAADDLLQEVVDYQGLCGPYACVDPVAELAFRPASLNVREQSTPYSPLKAAMPLSVWPMLRSTDKNVEVGGVFFLGDYVEKHYLEAMVTVGKDNFFMLSYWLDALWPTLNFGAMRYSYKGTYGYGIDQDDLPETNDLHVVDLKFEQLEEDLWVFASYYPSWYLWLGAGADVARYSFREAGDGPRWVPFEVNAGVGLSAEWTPSGASYAGDDWINPRGGRRLYLDVQRRWTRIVDPEIAGAVYDDGELMDEYGYWQLSASWTEFIPVPFFERHTLQLDFEAGYIDKNVMAWDEFYAGGRHPFDWGSGTIGNNVQFSGYEGWSLTGETLLIANASYRFPLVRDLNLKIGPTYTESLYLQLFGSVGNLWSYKVEGDTHIEGYSVVPDAGSGRVLREIPFKDFASKNSPPDHPNYLLADAGLELRVRQFIWNDFDWDSFLRVSYGFFPTAGSGDVNADLTQSSLARDAATELSAEIEPATIRVYLGVGTGW